MRCRPGDTALVVNDLEVPANNGKFVLVIARANHDHYTLPVDWDCEPMSSIIGTNGDVFFRGDVHGYRDTELRPIRDPGDDAVDQTLVPGYVRDEVTA